MNIRKHTLTILYCFIAWNLVSQGESDTWMKPGLWKISSKDEATFERFDGRETLFLDGKAILKEADFSNGTIEVDVYANQSRGFAGIIFRKQGKTMEEVYMRMHKSSQVDAVQYAPTYKGELNWQLYKEYQAQVRFKREGWNTLRIDIHGKRADIFINGEKELSVDDLRVDHETGQIGLFALFGNRFSNFRFSPAESSDNNKDPEKAERTTQVISKWAISEAYPMDTEEPDFKTFSSYSYKTVSTEPSGLLPISKYIQKPSSGNFERNKEVYAIASTVIESDREESRIFSFDYSDRITVYLNGQPIFKGNNAFRSKGAQYQGHIDTRAQANELFLDLKKGKNTLHCVVIDKANGWGIVGRLK